MKYRIFEPACEAVFLSRPNRFVVEVRTAGEIVRAHCPNPGRMRELLVPGRSVFLEQSDSASRKTSFTLAAVKYDDRVIPLISSRSNNAVGKLFLPRFYPEYEAISEQRLGESRLDWLLKGPGGKLWLEVKACTLVEHHRAMFPDAPSDRAVKHLRELKAQGSDGRVIFTVMNDSAEVFSANPHTDPNFAMALDQAQKAGVQLHAVSMKCDTDGWLSISDPELPIDHSAADLAQNDSGVVVKVWRVSDSDWRFSLEKAEINLARLTRSQRMPAGIPKNAKRDSTLIVRGKLSIFEFLEQELTKIFGPELFTRVFSDDPSTDPGFLALLFDYRHRRSFNF